MTILRGAFQSPRKQSKTGRSISRESDLVLVLYLQTRDPYNIMCHALYCFSQYAPTAQHFLSLTVMGLAEKLAGTIASASIIWFSNWQMPYFAVGVLSLVAAAFAQRFLAVSGHGDDKEKRDEDGNKKKMTLGQIVRRITRIPAFLCLVGPGIFGGIPWDMMSFLLLLFEWRGLSREQIVSIQFTKGISGTIGTPLGGFLGDRFAHLPRGRIYVALTSVVLGTISFGIFLFSTTYKSIFFWFNLFHLVAGWTTAAANRPICAEMAQNPSERAQIVSLWLLLEKVSVLPNGFICMYPSVRRAEQSTVTRPSSFFQWAESFPIVCESKPTDRHTWWSADNAPRRDSGWLLL